MSNKLRLVCFIVCSVLLGLIIFWGITRAQEAIQNAKKPPTHEIFRLSNGLTVILQENHKVKRVAIESFYRAGFIHEPKDKAHISHVVEHLVCYCPTQNYKDSESFNLIQSLGMVNAETLATFVHYDYIVPSDRLELVLKIEQERLTSIRFDEEILKREILRCLQEIEFVENSPQGGLIKFGLMGLNQAIHFGKEHAFIRGDITKLTVEDVQQFHKKHYIPNNAILIIVGDFNSAQTKVMVEKYFGNISKAEVPNQVMSYLKDRTTKWDLGSDALYLVYPNKGKDTNECIVLTLFGNYLCQQLFTDANLKKVAKMSFCSNQTYPVGEWPFFIFAEARQEHNIDEVQTVLKSIVAKTLNGFNATVFSQLRFGLLGFMRQSALKTSFIPRNMKYEMILGQEALNLGIKHLIKAGLSQKEFLERLNNLNFKTANKILKRLLAGNNERKIVFLTIQEEEK